MLNFLRIVSNSTYLKTMSAKLKRGKKAKEPPVPNPFEVGDGDEGDGEPINVGGAAEHEEPIVAHEVNEEPTESDVARQKSTVIDSGSTTDDESLLRHHWA